MDLDDEEKMAKYLTLFNVLSRLSFIVTVVGFSVI